MLRVDQIEKTNGALISSLIYYINKIIIIYIEILII